MTAQKGFRSLRSLQPFWSTPIVSHNSLVPEVLWRGVQDAIFQKPSATVSMCAFRQPPIPTRTTLGFELGTPEQKIFKGWLTNRYDAPSGDMNQSVDLASAALYEEFARLLLLETANSSARPQCQIESFFRRYADD